jgi:hypothetical protein
MYGKTNKGKHAQEGNTSRETHMEIYTCGGTYRDICTGRHLHGVTHAHMATHAWRDKYRGCMHRDIHMGMHTWGYPWGHTYTEETHTGKVCMGKQICKIYAQGDTYA